ncbi:DUF6049 family protein [Actinoallomurus rhizosphaericola]|uniref:DUF6049 family protein n=1 Tax=Actinoallomurus rhizosphaericola TaxID=2952536 RepID=UPI0020937E40|nr:DUF6049 family protein [Actinoallomurus rhizosphaericola]MCO5995101.1 DUF6049 family protein [Actinoallomurus rhizosphaericola]
MKRLLALVVPMVLTGGPALAATTPPRPGTTHTTHSGRATTRAATPERASRETQPAAKSPVNVIIDSVSPSYLTQPSQILRLRGQVQNQSDNAYQRLTVRLVYSTQPERTRGALQAYADGKGSDPFTAGPAQALSAATQPGGKQPWALKLPVSRMHLPGFGVYPLAVEVLNSVDQIVARQRTFVTYFPKTTFAMKTKVSWVWPVIDQPHRADDSTFTDDRLERALGTGGRLNDLVAAAAPYKWVSWLLDPALADDAAKMTDKDGYSVKGAHKPKNAVAGTWLNTLRTALAGKTAIATPYADPDVMALSRAGLGQDVKTAVSAAGTALGRANLPLENTSVAVPPDGSADQRTLTDLVKAGASTILLNSTTLPNLQAQSYTADPTTQKEISGKNVRLIAYDDTLSKVLAAEADEPGGVALTEQRFLAETAMITNEQPANPRSVVIVPPRRWSPGPALARDLLKFTAHAPWMRPTQLGTVAKQRRPEPRTFLPQKGSTGLSKHYLKPVKDLRREAWRFDMIFQPPASGFSLGVLRVESSAWGDQTRTGLTLRQTLENRLRADQGEIKVLNDHFDLAGKSGQVPITVFNHLEHGTVKVKLRAVSQNNTRLHVEGPGAKQSEITLEPGHKETVNLYMKAVANGPAYVYLQLLGPDGQPFTTTRVLQVRATAYGRTALLITGISLAVLFVGVGYRVIRRRGDEAEGTTGD